MNLKTALAAFVLLSIPHLSFGADAKLCPQAKNRSQVLDCLSHQLDALNKELAKAEAEALAQAKEDDTIAPIYENKKALTDSMKSFSDYREAECQRQNALTLSGTITGGLAKANCQIKLTKARITVLKMGDEK